MSPKCFNLGYLVLKDNILCCVCQPGWHGVTCNSSMFLGYPGRIAGYQAFTILSAIYSAALLFTSLWFMLEHRKHDQPTKHVLSPGIVCLSSLFFLLYMALNPFGQRFTYNKFNFFLQSLFLNAAITFQVSSFTFIAINELNQAYKVKYNHYYGAWSNGLKGLFFLICGALFGLSILMSALELITMFSTLIFMGIIYVFSALVGIIILFLSIRMYNLARMTLGDGSNNKRRIDVHTIAFGSCTVVTVLCLIIATAVISFFKESFIPLFSIGFVIPSLFFMFLQTISLFCLKHRDGKMTVKPSRGNIVTDDESENDFSISTRT